MKTSLLQLVAVTITSITLLLINLSCDNPVEPTNNVPVVTIVTPAENMSYLEKDTISFTATATDTEDGALSGGSLVWTSNIDGQFGTGKTCQSDSLSVNTHKIALSATDSKGAVGTAG